jgi:hypothetical protein
MLLVFQIELGRIFSERILKRAGYFLTLGSALLQLLPSQEDSRAHL